LEAAFNVTESLARAGAGDAVAERPTTTFTRAQQGAFSLAIYRRVLEQVVEGKVFTLTVSTGEEERVFFFTRGAILFLATGTSGGEVLARKIVAQDLLPKEKVDVLVKRANSDTPLLQDILREDMILEPSLVSTLVEEAIEDHLLELMLWEGSLALYDLVPGNPPPRLYEHSVPALRLSVGAKALLERVLGRREEAFRVLSPLGGSLRHRVRLEPGATVKGLLAKHVSEVPRAIGEIVAAVAVEGTPPFRGAQAVAELVSQKKLRLERTTALTKEEEVAQALRIEDSFESFLNALLARTHLAAIYERAGENEKAADQYRGMAEEHLKRDAVVEGVAALRNVIRLLPQDIGARELLVKVLRGANRLADAGKECVELARVLLDQNLPGRARQAYELALKLVPKTLSVLWMLAGLLGFLGEKEDAIKRYEEIAQIAHEQHDQDAEIAAQQQVLELDPGHGKALEVVRRLSGYRDALRRRLAAVSGTVLLFLAIMGYGAYEMAALSGFKAARDKARAALDEQDFDLARSAVNEFLRGWTFTRFKGAAQSLLASIGDEERLFRSQRSLREERKAGELEVKEELPQAVSAWRSALEDTEEAERKALLAAALAQCEQKLKKVTDDLERAALLEKSYPERAYDIVTADVPHAPWLLEDKDLRVPLLLDSIPKEARILVEGEPLVKPTPYILERSFLPLRVRLEGRNREPLERTLKGIEAWPLVLVLPRKPAWNARDVVASSEPLFRGDAVIVAGVDREVKAVARETGKVLWRTSLGIFGECDAPLVALEEGVLVARARSGTVFGLSSSGEVRFACEVEPPPQDLLERNAERPVLARDGVLVREGARGLALVLASGAVLWHARAPGDLLGAPSSSGELALASGERQVFAWKVATGELAWTVDLPQSPVLGPVFGPKGLVFVPLEQGGLARLDPAGKLLSVVKEVFETGVSPALLGDERWLLVGSTGGALAALDEEGKPVFRAFTAEKRAVLWVRASTYSVLYGDEEMLYALDREGKEVWRTPVRDGAPAVADDRQVYQGSADGFSCYDR